MKFGQVIEYYKRNICFQKSCRERGRETSSSPLLKKKEKRKALHELKVSCLQNNFNIVW